MMDFLKKEGKALLLILGALLFLAFFQSALAYKKRVALEGREIFLPIYPLSESPNIYYQNLIPDHVAYDSTGTIVVKAGGRSPVPRFVRLHNKDEKLKDGEFLISYKIKRPRGFAQTTRVGIYFGAEKLDLSKVKKFPLPREAHYVILSVNAQGKTYLHGVADSFFEPL